MLLDLFFPRHSLSGSDGEWITDDEWRAMRAAIPVVTTCRQLRNSGIKHLDGAVSCAHFRAHPLLRKAVHLLKYKHIPDVAQQLGTCMADALCMFEIGDSPPVLIPLPLHWTRRFARGYNQSALLANVIAQQSGLLTIDMLRRRKKTRSQVGLHREERRKNIQSAFAVRRRFRPPRCAVLVDDVLTTGATLDAAAQALKAAGTTLVFALTLAKEE